MKPSGSVRSCVREVRAAAADKWSPRRREVKPSLWTPSHPENTSDSVLPDGTWRRLARGPMRDDSVDSSLEETPGQASLSPPSPSPSTSLTAAWPRAHLDQVCFHRALTVLWQPSNSTASD
ncbi:unnamed protein product [Pleuronectes platessa]|uniref:Uncharacterized protein n=1 Tax=Pleuronectes platessa TaxID=8262 RepID=A0A9N7TUA8_PLEPL|nr:unnamed protein product [Pleuronectes platessa]